MQQTLDALEIESVGPDVYRAQHVEAGRGVVFGGEMLGQAIVAAQRTQPDKRVRTIHSVFARGVRTDRPADIRVESMHGGRNLGSLTVSFVQDDRLCARALVLMDVEEPDLIRHARPMPVVPGPDPTRAHSNSLAAPETILVGGVDITDPTLTGPPSLQMWVRFPGAPDEPGISRALLAYATDGWLIATALRPHAGFGQAMAHVEISTGVVSHSLSFEDAFRADEWLLIDHEAVHAGNGRAFGRADVFTEDGRLVASFSQDALIRGWPEGQSPVGREATAF
ncbi:acyl-CoA thioesterase II [Blastococcus sp. URHD0036]|uniref:acyl-CoA thioesterase n=1 Tax=Blastococcus sp. URHD0036 TaxID=1380356 RepID=UPI0004984D23|nr:acyl-CoA thioesterase domain-containing protein [Blastococcus sp. URHD0036]